MFADSTLRRPPLPFPTRGRPPAPVAAPADVGASGATSRTATEVGGTGERARLNGADRRPPHRLGAPWELVGLRTLYGQ